MQETNRADYFGFRPQQFTGPAVSKRPQFAPTFANAWLALDDAVTALPQSGLYEAPMHWRAAVGLWMRSLEACRATLVLTDQRMFGAAMATMRSALECLFYAGALWKNPDLHPTWLNWQLLETEKQAKAVKASEDYTRLTEENRQLIDEWIAMEKGPAKLDAYLAAKHADLEWLYTIGYRGTSSGGAHATPLSLNIHLQQVGGVPVFSLVPDMTAVSLLMHTLKQCLTAGSLRMQEHASDAIFRSPSPE